MKPRASAPTVMVLALAVACGANTVTVGGSGADGGVDAGAATSRGAGGAGGAGGGAAAGGGLNTGGGQFDAGPTCPPPAQPPDDAGVVMHPDFAAAYTFSELGPVPGVPGPLGGCVILQNDRDHLLIAGASERASGGLYRVKLRRDACGHITGYDGAATKLADTPFIDANILEVAGGSLLYTGWQVWQLSQLTSGASAPLWTVDLSRRGQMGSSAGGLGRVPPWLAAAGEFRIVGWPDGRWHKLALTVDAGVYAVTSVSETRAMPLSGGPGGFAYVPLGSAQFTKPSLIISEWSANEVSVIEVDQQGNPVAGTRRRMFSRFPRPWGAYFEPETGDFLFLTWARPGLPDSVFIVRGFQKPPPVIE